MTEDGVCPLCGEMTNHLAANPSWWPVYFTHPDGSGIARAHHASCVRERSIGVTADALAALRAARKAERASGWGSNTTDVRQAAENALLAALDAEEA